MSDGREGTAQFNRSAAYNRGIQATVGADVIIFNEADLIVPHDQLWAAVRLAARKHTLVVPFRNYHQLSPTISDQVLGGISPFGFRGGTVYPDGFSVGAVNVCSAQALNAIGQWDETFEGAWYDDNAMFRAFQVACGTPEYIEGEAYHLWHIPGNDGEHLTAEDRAATERNKARWENLYQRASTPDEIRALTSGAF